MRVVLDTNVLISAALKNASVPAIAVRIVEQRHVFLKSTATESQLFEVLARPYLERLIAPAALEWLRKLLGSAQATSIVERISACRDSTDDKFLELAVNGGADLVVSGDADLPVLDPFRDIPIITPAAFVEIGGAPSV